MKHTVTIVLLFISICTHAQPISFSDWKEEAKKDNRLLPEYGGTPRSKQQLADDEAYIKTATEEMHATRHDGSEQLVTVGFKYLGEKDPRVAMYRFNQAWILDHENSNVYAGFGSVYVMLKELDSARKYYNKGLLINPNNPNLLTDLATCYLASYETSKDTNTMNLAGKLLARAYQIEPKHPNTTFRLSQYYMMQNNCDSALKYYYECKKTGGQNISAKFDYAIKNRCNIAEK